MHLFNVVLHVRLWHSMAEGKRASFGSEKPGKDEFYEVHSDTLVSDDQDYDGEVPLLCSLPPLTSVPSHQPGGSAEKSRGPAALFFRLKYPSMNPAG